MTELFLKNLPGFAAALFLVSFVGTYLHARRRNTSAALEDAIVNGLSLSSAPTGIAFLICAFRPEYLPIIGDQTLSFIIGGAVILHISAKYGMPR